MVKIPLYRISGCDLNHITGWFWARFKKRIWSGPGL